MIQPTGVRLGPLELHVRHTSSDSGEHDVMYTERVETRQGTSHCPVCYRLVLMKTQKANLI